MSEVQEIPRLRRGTYQGAYVIEFESGEGRGWTFLKFDGINVPAWSTRKNCDRQIESVAAQLRAADKEVIIDPPA